MAIVINFAGASIRKPGAYSRTRIAAGGAAEAQLGIVALIGEANEGLPFASESGLSAVTFTPDQFGAIVEKFGSGPLVDAAKVALGPSNDPQILGGAQQLILIKTNASTLAQLTLPTSYGTVKAKKSGAPGNNISVGVSVAGSTATITVADVISGVSEVSSPIGGTSAMTLQVAGGVSAATLTISATSFAVTCTGGTAPSVTVPIGQFATLSQLVAFLNTQSGYTASLASPSQGVMPLTILDRVSAVDVKTSPYNILRDAYDIRQFFAASGLVDFVPTAYIGIPSTLATTYLSGGAKGASTNAGIQTGLDALLKARVNFVVPLFSRSASGGDIADGLTDAGSTYTIDSIHAAVRTHVAQASTVKGRKERQGFVAYKGAKATVKDKAAALGSGRVSIAAQDVDVQDAAGSLYTAQPHMLQVINAGMKAAAVVGLSNTFKLCNINGFSHVDMDPETDADEMIEANVTFVEKAPGGGFRFVLDNSTYGQVKDAWFWSRPSVVYASDVAAFAIRLNTETFVGQRNSDVTPETIKNLMVSVMDSLRASGIIVPDANTGGKGYKDLVVKFLGSVISISVTLALVENYEFVLNDITVARASA